MRVVNVPMLFLCLMTLHGACACQGPRVQILGVTGKEWSSNFYGDYNNLVIRYGSSVNIYCSGNNSKNLSIKLEYTSKIGVNTGRQFTTVANDTTLQLTVEKPVAGTHLYNCTDVETGCASHLEVVVHPQINIKSGVVFSYQNYQNSFGNCVNYYVSVGEDYEVVCFGHQDLGIAEDKAKIKTISVNETVIKSLQLHKEKYSQSEYRCFFRDVDFLSACASVYIDFDPAAVNFWCVEDSSQIDCFWSVVTMDTTFTLVYTEKNQNSMHVCEDHSIRKKTRHCEWSIKELQSRGLAVKDNFTLVVQACNLFYCKNETYFMNHDSIRKVESPVNLELFKTSSHGTSLKWVQDLSSMRHKVMYRMSGSPKLELNASSFGLYCKYINSNFFSISIPIGVHCEVELKLPCPAAFYAVEIYSKLKSTPSTNDAYWSEPASITFWTKPPNSTDVVDPACITEPELIDNKYAAVYEIKKFERSFHKDGLEFLKKVKSMKNKINKIKKLCHELALYDCEHYVMSSIIKN